MTTPVGSILTYKGRSILKGKYTKGDLLIFGNKTIVLCRRFALEVDLGGNQFRVSFTHQSKVTQRSVPRLAIGSHEVETGKEHSNLRSR